MDQSEGQNKYGYLNQLSTTYLEGILRADIESSEGGDEDMILYILEVIEQRRKNNQTGAICDVAEAWEEFQEHYMGLKSPLYPTAIPGNDSQFDQGNVISIPPQGLTEVQHRHSAPQRISRTFLKRLLLVAATISVLLAGMVTAQAVGMDVFGALAKWTDEIFRFVSPVGEYGEQGTELKQAAINSDAQELHDALQAALDECRITENLAPTWFPEGCVMVEGPEATTTEYTEKVCCKYQICDDTYFEYTVQRYDMPASPGLASTEKDNGSVEQHLANGRLFYIISNNGNLTAAWSDGESLSLKVFGTMSNENLKQFLDSIGA